MKDVIDAPYRILLYYCYTHLENPDDFREHHHLFCLQLGLRGRIIIANEGINGTVSGTSANCELYMESLRSDRRFQDIDFKVENSPKHGFKKLNVRVKPEIVNAGLPGIHPRNGTGKYVEPEEFKKFKDDEDVVILDVRSNHEHSLGKFKDSVTLDINHFREFPDKVKDLRKFAGRKIVTYCTGGIKCEKASAYLLDQGFENVYQLHGGIIKYGLEAGGEDFEGKCYVFDNRVAVDVNRVNPKVLSTCHVCGKKDDRMVNCSNPVCNLHVVICEECGWKYEGACSSECQQHPAKREYDGTGYYQKDLNGYDPYKNAVRSDYGSPEAG